MLLKQEKRALLLLIAVTAAVLCGYAIIEIASREAFATPYHEGSPDGAPVIHEGLVTGYTLVKSGGHLILEVNGVTVFIPGNVAGEIGTKKGDLIRVIGIVQTYQGKKEILVKDPGDLTVQKLGASNTAIAHP